MKGVPKPADLPHAVWINPLAKKKVAQDAPGTAIATLVDLQHPLISGPSEHAVATTIDVNATLITFTLGASMSLTASKDPILKVLN